MFNRKKIEEINSEIFDLKVGQGCQENSILRLEKKFERLANNYIELDSQFNLLMDYLKVQVQDSITIKKIVKKK